MSTGKKRFWSDDEKREICVQTRVEGASVAQVARRYAVNANLIHKWLRDPRFSRKTERTADFPAVDGFLRVEIEDAEVVTVSNAPIVSADAAQTPLRATRVDLTLSDGRRVLIEGPTALRAVPPSANLCARGLGYGSLHTRRLGWEVRNPVGTAGQCHQAPRPIRPSHICRRHACEDAGTRQWQDQDGTFLGL
jgi:transposase